MTSDIWPPVPQYIIYVPYFLNQIFTDVNSFLVNQPGFLQYIVKYCSLDVEFYLVCQRNPKESNLNESNQMSWAANSLVISGADSVTKCLPQPR